MRKSPRLRAGARRYRARRRKSAARKPDRRRRCFLHDHLLHSPAQESVGHRRDWRSFAQMLRLLANGLALWILYGLMRSDSVIVAANAVSLTLVGCIIWFKLRERKA